jgi:uncharacterized protein (TIGR04222 family)
MIWPLEAIATMPGPQFLILYGCVIALTLAVCRWMWQRADSTAELPSVLVPSEPDPYEIAYLRGGERELSRVLLVNLMKRGYLYVTNPKEQRIERTRRDLDAASLTRIERRLFDWFSKPRQVEELFKDASPQLEADCEPYRQRLESERLLAPPDAQDAAWRVRLVGGSVMVSLGAYKLLTALAANRPNVWFLIGMGIASLVMLAMLCPVPRLSNRGRAYLKSLQVAFEPLKPLQIAFEPLKQQNLAVVRSGAESTLILLVGLFGVGVLNGTAYSSYTELFPKASSSSSDGCGSCSGCGGCGGCGCD